MEGTLWGGPMTGAGTPHYTAHVTWTRRPAARVTVRSGMFGGAERRFAGGGSFGEAGAGGTIFKRCNIF